MARSYGKILASLVTDDEFNDLSGDEQALYFRLLGHPALSLVGKLDYRPNHWCRYGRNWTRDTVEALVFELTGRHYLALDLETEEVLIRSLTRHDGIPIGNPKLRKGLWGAWGAVASTELRRIAVANMPNELFNQDDVPANALRIRRSIGEEHRIEPLPDYLIPQGTGWCPDSPPSIHHPPVTTAVAESDPDSGRADPQVVKNSLSQAWSSFDRSPQEVSTDG